MLLHSRIKYHFSILRKLLQIYSNLHTSPKQPKHLLNYRETAWTPISSSSRSLHPVPHHLRLISVSLLLSLVHHLLNRPSEQIHAQVDHRTWTIAFTLESSLGRIEKELLASNESPPTESLVYSARSPIWCSRASRRRPQTSHSLGPA